MRDAAGDWEPVEALLATANEAGHAVSRPQLHRWQREGLLPRPRQVGLGRGHGSLVLYPPGSARQLVALCDQRKEKRSLDFVSWALWWQGFEIREERVRRILHSRLDYAERIRAADGTDKFVEALEDGGRVRLDHPVVANMRRRVGRNDFPTLMNHVLRVFSGLPPTLTDDDSEILSKVLGFSSAPEAENSLGELAKVFDPDELRIKLDGSSISEIEQARDEVRNVLKWMDPLILLIEQATRLRPIRGLADALQLPDPKHGAHLLMLWLRVRETPVAQVIRRHALSLLRDVASGALIPSAAGELIENQIRGETRR